MKKRPVFAVFSKDEHEAIATAWSAAAVTREKQVEMLIELIKKHEG